MCSKVVVYFSVLGGYIGLVGLVNGLQLCSHFYHQRTVAALPLLFQRYMCVLCTFYCCADLIVAVPTSTTFFLYSLSWVCRNLAEFLAVVLFTQWAFEISRTAYLTMYVGNKYLPKWPFVVCCLQTLIAIIVTSALAMSTNRQKYRAVAYILAAFQFFVIAGYTTYYCHQLVTSFHTLPQSELSTRQDIPTRIQHYWHFVAIMSMGLLIVVILLVVESAAIFNQDSLFYDASQACVFNLNFLGVFRNLVFTIASVWAYRKVSSSKYLVAPRRDRSVAVSAFSNSVLPTYATGEGNG